MIILFPIEVSLGFVKLPLGWLTHKFEMNVVDGLYPCHDNRIVSGAGPLAWRRAPN